MSLQYEPSSETGAGQSWHRSTTLLGPAALSSDAMRLIATSTLKIIRERLVIANSTLKIIPQQARVSAGIAQQRFLDPPRVPTPPSSGGLV